MKNLSINIYKKSITNIILNGERVYALDQEQNKNIYSCHFYSTFVLEIPARVIRQEK